MRILIRNPAPTGHRQKKWGDYYFGRSLTKYLERYGASVSAEYRPEWGCSAKRADATIVLRGKFRSGRSAGGVNILWCVSHPGTLTVEECEDYDAVCVGSQRHASMLQKVLSVPVIPLLQCTDEEEFHGTAAPQGRRHVVFVGNTRGVRRQCVDWTVEYGLPLQIYGAGWTDFGHSQRVVSEYIPNEELPHLYAGARMTLNDHWNDMREYGYINNRIFDALASGLPIVSDGFEDLRSLCGDGVLYYDDRESFRDAMQQVLLEYPLVLQRTSALWQRLSDTFTFSSRARYLLSLIADLRSVRAGRSRQDAIHRDTGADVEASPSPFGIARVETIQRMLGRVPGKRLCPLCGTVADRFASDEAGGKESAKCGRCGALESHRLLWFYLVNVLWPKLPSRGKQILDLAPEKPVASLLSIHPEINYLSGALQAEDAMAKLDVTSLDLPDKKFDLLLFSLALAPISNDARAVQEMYRVIRPGGYAILQLPIGGTMTHEELSVATEEYGVKHGERDRGRQYRDDMVSRLEDAGFRVIAQRPIRALPVELCDALGLTDQTIIECQRLPD